MERRPTIDGAMELDAAKIVAAKMGVTDVVGIADSICAEYSYPMDGFGLCKKLDRWHSWDSTREDMDLLDEMDSLCRRALDQAEKEWFERNHPAPPYPIGTRIEWKGVTGTIDGIYEHGPGKYLVKPDKSTIGDGRYIVNFEDARLATKEPA